MVELYINKQRVDLFSDESIQVSETVKSAQDLGLAFTDYSQSFTLPASANNNKIFDFYFNSDTLGSNDYRQKQEASIFIDGVHFKSGHILLEGAKVINDKAQYYTVSFFGFASEVIKKLKETKLNDVDLSNLNHHIKFDVPNTRYLGSATWTKVLDGDIVNHLGNQISDDLFYPFIFTDDDVYYDANSLTAETNNLAYWNTSSGQNSFVYLKPAISLKSILEAINNQPDLPTIQSSLLTDSFFQKIFMWTPISNEPRDAITIKEIDVDWGLTESDSSYINEDNEFVATESGLHNFKFTSIVRTNGTVADTYLVTYVNGMYHSSNNILFTVGSYTKGVNLNAGDRVKIKFEMRITNDIFLTSARFNLAIDTPTISNAVSKSSIDVDLSHYFRFNSAFGDFTAYDFLSVIVKMFNGIVESVSEDTIKITPYEVWIAGGDTVDIDKFIDSASISISNTELYNDIKFKTKEQKTINNIAFKTEFGREFGNLEAIFDFPKASNFVVDCDYSLTLSELFTVIRPTGTTTLPMTIARSYKLDKDKLTPEIPERLFIVRNAKANLSGYNLIGQLDPSRVLTPYTFSVGDGTKSIQFANDTDPQFLTQTSESLYQQNYDAYINQLYNIQSRIIEVELDGNIALINDLKLNSIVIINGRKYEILEKVSELTNGKIKLKLLRYIL